MLATEVDSTQNAPRKHILCHEHEIIWRDHYQYFKDHGYTLRRRYEPDWTPSWITGTKNRWDCEDGVASRHAYTVDATRRDGTFVVLKLVERTNYTFKNELAVGNLFSSPELSTSPGNHCVPILDVIPPKDGSETTFIVTPLLYRADVAPYETIGEIVDFFRQILEGLKFMHNHNVVHGDCKSDNIMANFGGSYDHPPHPMNRFKKRDFSGRPSPPISRTIKPIKYYFIDFDLSQIYGSEEVRLRTPPWGGDRSVPEHLIPNDPPCDPFPVDVYCIAHVIKEYFLDGDEDFDLVPKQGLDFMRGLVSDMTIDDPKRRPTMDQVVSRFDEIVEGLSEWTLRSPVVNVGQSYGLFASISHWVKQLVYVIRGIPAIPRAQ